MGLDCGPASIDLNAKAVSESKTIIWNGPMGFLAIQGGKVDGAIGGEEIAWCYGGEVVPALLNGS